MSKNNPRKYFFLVHPTQWDKVIVATTIHDFRAFQSQFPSYLPFETEPNVKTFQENLNDLKNVLRREG